MKTRSIIGLAVAFFGLYLGLATPAAGKTAAAACPADSVLVGRTCVDKYEASVWDLSGIPAGKAKTTLIAAIKAGTATEASLLAAGAIQRGVSSADYGCNVNGNDCTNIFAVSITSVTPSRFITWFQAQQAAMNSGKRLLTNAEWQGAAAGTPDPGTDNGTTDCNISAAGAVVDTGSRSNCVSRFGVFDMVGNLWEWVADWVPPSSGNCGAALFAGDDNCLAGDAQAAGTSALVRGGGFDDSNNGAVAGVFAISAGIAPSQSRPHDGFRAAR
jgi:formylglycine-generating enzyme required for sulfatase activity